MRRTLPFLLALGLCGSARAAVTSTPPAGVLVVDESYLQSSLDERWDDNRQAQPLIANIPRYEPGGPMQGTITARPTVSYQVAITQLLVGITDNWMGVVALPVVLDTTIHTNLGWIPGAYQPTLGRAYSEADFWAWAASMGQSKPPATWQGNQLTLADMVVGTRYRLPSNPVGRTLGIDIAGTVLVALPTGHNPNPEQLVSAGTNTWELDNYGDLELHLGVDKTFRDSNGVSRFNVGAEAYYAYFRPRTYVAPTGSLYPLLLDEQPYVGGTYTIKPGDWWVGLLELEGTPVLGPTRASFLSGGDLQRARSLPGLLTLSVSATYVYMEQTTYTSNSALFDWQHDDLWLPGNKNALKGTATVSLMRLGLPLQLYTSYRNQTWIPGKNSRPADTFSAGARVLIKAW